MPRFDVEIPAKEPDLIRFGFEVGDGSICQHEIEYCQTGSDVFEFMATAVPQIFASELTVELASEEVIDRAVPWHGAGACVLVGLQLVPEKSRALSPLHARKGKELPSDEVTGMRGNDVQKACFFFGITEGLQRADMDSVDVHSARIRAAGSVSSRMRRNFEASSRGE